MSYMHCTIKTMMHNMKAKKEVDLWLHSFVTSALGKRSVVNMTQRR